MKEDIKDILRHFEIKAEDFPTEPLSEINNNENTRKAYGIDRIMRGRADKKVRIVIDYDADFPKLILRVFSKDSPQEVKEPAGSSYPNM